MFFQPNIYSIVLLFAGLIILLLTFILLSHRHKAASSFAWVLFCISIWAIFYALELSSLQYHQVMLWIRLEYIGISFLPAAWIFFSLHFTNSEKSVGNLQQIAIFAFPAITLLMVLTNTWHHLHYQSTFLDESGPFPLLAIEPGPWYHVHTVYFYFLLALGIILITRRWNHIDIFYRKQRFIIFVAALFPWFANVLYLSGIRPYQHLDLTPFAFIMTGLFIFFGLFRFSLFDVIPLAREKILDSMREGLLVLDLKTRVIDKNTAMNKFLSPGTEKIIGRKLADLFPKYPDLLSMPGMAEECAVEIEMFDNRALHVEVSYAPVKDDKNKTYGSLLIFWDISEKKKVKEKLEIQAKELKLLNGFKDKMFSVIAHDLKSPLTNLLALLEYVDQGMVDEKEFKDYIAMISNRLGTTSTMLNDLLEWSRSQFYGDKGKTEDIWIKPFLENSMELYQKMASEKGIHLECRCDEEHKGLAEVSMLNFVLRNLITNSIKFCMEGDSIIVASEKVGNELVISIKDTGTGMLPEVHEKIFSMEIVSVPGTRNEKGTGLGLKLTKEFVEKNGGRIWAESEYEKGSIFYFTLPLPTETNN
ncbi:MAG: PAS domain-containing protein [Cyclobacteriaceae bacterium]|nr:PAS domain-containing protein [Cyclobacteriaceae bacterium]